MLKEPNIRQHKLGLNIIPVYIKTLRGTLTNVPWGWKEGRKEGIFEFLPSPFFSQLMDYLTLNCFHVDLEKEESMIHLEWLSKVR